ncbi:hypothetical protein [Staphylococcus agnetis]|uniref:DUF4064 domain-containing protein n=1 Tax=Staphylococcus agnetis TaxID=985762 RepID=A0ABX3Z7J0_9STAP|nr:hypothetical protein [Staphylococcus agnetis]ALN77134.1 hypothetical protein EP23_07130 [Staphylococcus agnetis]MDG4943317.1 hypothetical protein [Staphylococcus agnetis]OSP17893.1 hypothetical protein B9L42_08730 [Staphylococcus agnetis]OSP24695.1 hypothetical protein B9M87_02190 [Staphylococcus agnetis]OTW31902.1 hypothetical protein B9M88_02150 [Staphylococcus agnetis]
MERLKEELSGSAFSIIFFVIGIAVLLIGLNMDANYMETHPRHPAFLSEKFLIGFVDGLWVAVVYLLSILVFIVTIVIAFKLNEWFTSKVASIIVVFLSIIMIILTVFLIQVPYVSCLMTAIVLIIGIWLYNSPSINRRRY